MARRASLRASDSDRERVAERLRHATGEGRLLAEELEARLEAAFAARTYGELDALVADLPERSLAPRHRGRPARRLGPAPAIALILLAPMLVALVVAAVVVVATALAAWALLAAVLWWSFGHRVIRPYPIRYRRSVQAYGRWRA
jgi:hypothetical protein